MRLYALGVAGGLLVLLVAVLFLWRSSQPPGPKLYEGTITYKWFEPEHSATVLIPITHTSCSGGKSTTCTSWTQFIPVVKHWPDTWKIRVEGCKRLKDESPRNYCEKKAHRNVKVSVAEFNAAKAGQEWHGTDTT